MSATGWERLTQVFQQALQLPPTERAAFLDAACGGDAALRSEVESLIGGLGGARPLTEKAESAAVEVGPDPLLGSRIGSYRVLAEIGRGGMGAVYRAVRDDDVFRMEVAVKVLQSGLASEYHRERFRQERQILATLDHPHIARLLDGGATPDGRPYLVMELVTGEPIDISCRRRGMPVRERLALFRLVCGAVHYAHQNLIVHRDIKPGNVLVTPEGAPKLLDFGIAKLLPQPGEDATVTEFRALTPLYASPEQLRGEPITMASDVYSLGVVLYELLTGRRPLELSGRRPHEMIEVISGQEPLRPSDAAAQAQIPPLAPTEDVGADTLTKVAGGAGAPAPASPIPALRLARELRGDLDLIVMKALRKEPSRRYGSALELDEDLRRYLEGLPVSARPETFAYRGRKFVSRHRAGVGAALLLVASLATGVVATLVQWRRAEMQRERAERRFADLRQLANALIFELHDEVKDLAGATRARQMIVRRALEYLDRLARDGGEPALQRELATAYERIGDVQGVPGQGNLGDTPRALESHRKALAIREALGPGDPSDRRALASSLLKVGDLLGATGRSQPALDSYRRALALLEGDVNGGLVRERAAALSRIGRSLSASGDTPAALDALQRSVALYEADQGNAPQNPGTMHDTVHASVGLSSVLIGSARPAEAVVLLRRLLPRVEEVSARDPTNRRAWRDVGLVWERLGTALRDAGDLDGALQLFRRCLEMDETLVREDPVNVEARRDLAIDFEKVGRILLLKKDAAGALPLLRRCLSIRQALLEADPDNQQRRTDLSVAHYWIAQALLASKDTAGALEQMEATLELDETVARADAGNADAQDAVADTLVGLAAVLTESGAPEAALVRLDRARVIREQLLARDPSNADRVDLLAAVHAGVGDAWAARAARASGAASLAHWREARGAYTRGVAALGPLRERGPLSESAAATHAELERNVARCDAAIARR